MTKGETKRQQRLQAQRDTISVMTVQALLSSMKAMHEQGYITKELRPSVDKVMRWGNEILAALPPKLSAAQNRDRLRVLEVIEDKVAVHFTGDDGSYDMWAEMFAFQQVVEDVAICGGHRKKRPWRYLLMTSRNLMSKIFESHQAHRKFCVHGVCECSAEMLPDDCCEDCTYAKACLCGMEIFKEIWI